MKPLTVAQAIERFGHACDIIGWSKPPMPEADRAHANLVAAIAADYILRSEAKQDRAALVEALRELERKSYALICASNGIFDNEWRTPDGIAIPDFPVRGYGEIVGELDAARIRALAALPQPVGD